MRKLDENKLAKLHTAGELLDNKYGEVGTDSRTAFHEKSIAWYYGEILREHRSVEKSELNICKSLQTKDNSTGVSREGWYGKKLYCPCLRHRVHTYVFIIH